MFAASLRPAAAHVTVYENDFSVHADQGFALGVSGAWSTSSTSVTPSGRHGRFLGEFGGQTTSLTLTNLPPHRELTLSFLLFILKSWDGNAERDPISGLQVGPDVWSCTVSGGPTLLITTFSNIARFTGGGHPGTTYPQAFPGSYPGASFPPGAGSTQINTLGYHFVGIPMDAVYPLSFTFPHTSSTLTLHFAATGNLQSLADESWGLDNVEVRLGAGAPHGLTPPEVGIEAFLVRIGGEIFVVGTVANKGGSVANVTLRAATLALFNPLRFHETLEAMPLSLGVLAPGEKRNFGARFPGFIGPPGIESALTLSGVVQWQGSHESHPTQIFSRDFNNLRLP